MGVSKFTAEFEDEAIRQVTEKGRPVSEVAKRLGITPWTRYTWMKAAGVPTPARQKSGPASPDLTKENAALKAQIKRLDEERDILKKPRRTLPGNPGKVRLHQDAQGRVWG